MKISFYPHVLNNVSHHQTKKKSERAKLKRACFLYYMTFNNSALLYREAKALQKRGFIVDIIGLRSSKTEKIIQIFDGLKIYGIQSRPCAEKNVQLYFVRLLLFSIKATLFLTLMNFIKKYRLIHVTAPPDFMVFTAFIPKMLGTKIILDIHDISPELFMEKLHLPHDRKIVEWLKRVERISCQFADHVITVTEMWRKKLVARSVSGNKCTILLNVPAENLFKVFPAKWKNQSNGFRLFYHGSLEEHFGVDTLLHAMPMIRKYIPNAQLYIYGGGRLKDKFLHIIADMCMQQYTHIYDKVPFYQLPELLCQADVGIVPTKDSQFSDDTISMKSLEYMSLGIPIVISATTAHRYYFNDSMVIFFQPEDKDELARAVIALHEKKHDQHKLIENSRLFLKSHGWQNHKQIYLDIVERLMSNGRM